MRNIILCIFFLLSLQSFSLAQSDRYENRQRHPRDLGERITSRVEELLRSIGEEFGWETDTIPPAKKRAESDSTAERAHRETRTFDGDITIDSTERIVDHVVVRGGDLTVRGVVEGDVLVLDGDLFVKKGGVIEGDVRVINGKISRESGGTIHASINDRGYNTGRSKDKRRERVVRPSYTLEGHWIDEMTNLENFIFRYNRVEGIYLGLGSEKKYYWDGSKSYNAYGSFGYGFKSHRWRYNIGLTRQFALPVTEGKYSKLFELGIEGYSLTDSKDRWIVGLWENTLAAFLFQEDNRDYFGRDGMSLHFAYSLRKEFRNAQLQVAYLVDRYSSLSNNAQWSLFGEDVPFRRNLPINEGNMRSVIASAGMSHVRKTPQGHEGWSFFSSAEFADRSLGGIFDFSQFITDVRYYQPLGTYDNLNLRIRTGTSSGTVPLQKTFELGGISTLQARPFKSESGNRMVLANAEYIVNSDFLHDLDFWPSWLMKNVNFILLADAGWTSFAPSTNGWLDGFDSFLSNFKSDVGIGLSTRRGSLRFAFVWPTDHAAPATFIFRIARSF